MSACVPLPSGLTAALDDFDNDLAAKLPKELIDMVTEHALQAYKDPDLLRTQSKVKLGEDNTSAAQDPRNQVIIWAHVCQSFRTRALSLLWKTVYIDYVKQIATLDRLLASTKDAGRVYGAYVHHVEFAWACKLSDRPTHAEDFHAYCTRYPMVSPSTHVVSIAFANRTQLSSASLIETDSPEGSPPSLYASTDGPDGHGTVHGIETPAKLEEALARIFACLPLLSSLEWDATIFALPPIVAETLERTAQRHFHRFSHVSKAPAAERILRERQAVNRPPRVPGIDSSLVHLSISQEHETQHNDLTFAHWLLIDDEAPFGFVVAASCVEFGHASQPHWIIQACLEGAKAGCLKRVTLPSDKVLCDKTFLPLWLWLDVELHEDARDRLTWHPTDGGEEIAHEERVKGGARRLFSAIKAVRDVLRCYEGARQGDWVTAVAQAMRDDVVAQKRTTQAARKAAQERGDDEEDQRLCAAEMQLVATNAILYILLFDSAVCLAVIRSW